MTESVDFAISPVDSTSPLLSPAARANPSSLGTIVTSNIPDRSPSAPDANAATTTSKQSRHVSLESSSQQQQQQQAQQYPAGPRPRKAATNLSWGTPVGAGIRDEHDESLVIFRKALGINYHHQQHQQGEGPTASLEEGHRSACGIYRSVLAASARKSAQHAGLTALLYLCYFAQVVLGAGLTALGPQAGSHPVTITVLGATNTVIAGVLALVKGSGQPARLGKDQVEYRRLQDWIEETDALLAVGVIGRDRRDVGLLVEVAFRKYNAAKASEENNRPDVYVSQPMESLGNGPDADADVDADAGTADRRRRADYAPSRKAPV